MYICSFSAKIYVISILALVRQLCPSSMNELCVNALLLCPLAKFYPN